MNKFASPTTILVTGATGGLGRALALVYAAPLITLILHGRDPAKLAALRGECEQRGAAVSLLVADLAECNQWIATLDDACRQTAIDLVIVNAGATNIIDLVGESWPDVERMLDINLRAAMATVSVVLPHMRRRGSGQIALISSISAYVGLPVTPAYCASKAALKSYGEAMRGWLAPQGIAVNVVMPGFVDTAMSEQFPTSKPFLLPPEDAVRRIKAGLAGNRARISFPFPLTLGMWLLSMMPADWAQRILRLTGFAGVRSRNP